MLIRKESKMTYRDLKSKKEGLKIRTSSWKNWLLRMREIIQNIQFIQWNGPVGKQ